jgi:hypothetical protein
MIAAGKERKTVETAAATHSCERHPTPTLSAK